MRAIVPAIIATLLSACGSDNEPNPSPIGPGADASLDATADVVPDAPVPEGGCKSKSCAEVGASCGTAPDGCEGVVDCGSCPAGQTCGGGTGPNTCGVTECTPKTCVQLGASCGYVSDGCSKAIDCGACMGENACGGGGVDNQCGCMCVLPHAQTTCWNGNCSILQCEQAWLNCDNQAANGCETAVENSTSACYTAVNAGGPAVSPFGPDAYFAGGDTAQNWDGAVDLSEVKAPGPEAIYQTERYGTFSYTVPGLVVGGTYGVRLHFAENYMTAVGARRFNVALNGASVLSDFDVFAAAGGPHRANIQQFAASAGADGTVVIAFSPGTAQQAFVNGIELMPQTCGNGAIEGTEQCDEGAANGSPGASCSSECTPAGACGAEGLTHSGTAIATFESLGLYFSPPSDPGPQGCQLQFRKSTDCEWKQGLPMWYDPRDQECRGALVHLEPGTSYVVQFGMPGQPFSRELTASTWSETFPIGETVQLPAGTSNQSLAITTGGTASGYKLYTCPAGQQCTVDVGNAQPTNITISAPYVIVRGLTLRGAQQHAIRLNDGAHDVVIEDNDISGWGRLDTDAGDGGAGSELWGVYGDAGVYSSSKLPERIIVQRNQIHHPRSDSNSWGENRAKYSSYHPRGPLGIYLIETAGNHVIRYNDIYSDIDHMFNDVIGGDNNFSADGFPNRDSDIYGNRLSHAWDDGIEAEGGNKHVRIWGNYIDSTATGVATSSTFYGPLYIFRNVYNRSRKDVTVPLDSDDRLYFGKTGSVSPFGGGRRYFFHNTLLQATGSGATLTLGAGVGIAGNGTQRPIENTVTRNNIWHIWKTWWASIDTEGGTGNDMNFDLFNGEVNAYAGAEANGISGVPIYASGHGWMSEYAGRYQLAPSSPGYDQGEVVPNFNDGYAGAKPDMGAHEAGSPAMRIGACAGPLPKPFFCP